MPHAKRYGDHNRTHALPPDPLPRINELIAVSKAGWLGLLSYLAFVGVTLIGVEDADFFIVERRTQLPLIGVKIPTTLFFAIAPALGAMLYTYLHLYLLKLWEALAEAPEKLNGQAIGDSVRPWLVADYVLSYRTDSPLRERPLRGLANAVSGIFIFLAAPLVLAGFWWRSMPKHDELLTVFGCEIPLCVVLYVGITSWLRLRRLSRGATTALKWGRRGRSAWIAITAAVSMMSWFTTEGTLSAYARQLGIEGEGWWTATPLAGLLVPAKLTSTVFVETPSNWKVFEEARYEFRLEMCRSEGLSPSLCGTFYSSEIGETANLVQLRRSWCREKFPSVPGSADEFCDRYFQSLEDRFLTQWKKTEKLQSRLCLVGTCREWTSAALNYVSRNLMGQI